MEKAKDDETTPVVVLETLEFLHARDAKKEEDDAYAISCGIIPSRWTPGTFEVSNGSINYGRDDPFTLIFKFQTKP